MSKAKPNTLAGGIICLILVNIGCADSVLVPSDAQVDTRRPGITGLKKERAPKSDAACGTFPSYYFQYLDDTRCQKRLPTNTDRNLFCPNMATSTKVYSPLQEQTVAYAPAADQPVVDDEALIGVVPEDLRITLILVRRVEGKAYYRYLSNGSHKQTFQPWSSTKFMAVANAASNLRKQSHGSVGLTAVVDGVPLGDFSSMVHNYDEREYTSNGLARWFLNIGTRSQLSHYIHDQWLGRPTSEKIGGNYGHPTPDVNLDFVDTYGSVAMMGSDESGWVNRLSTLTIAEFLKRLVMHREDPDLALPHLKWSDVSTLMYGAEDSVYYDPATPQGMQGDTAVYLQSGLNMDELEKNSKGQWRIFGKLGFGYERGGEFVHASYGCFPKLDDQGQAIPDVGKEMIIVTQLNGQGDHHKTDARLASIYSTLVQGVMNGTIK